MEPQLTKPDIKVEDVVVKGRTRKIETWYLGQGSEVHNSVGCPHFFLQKTSNAVECEKCGLGLFGHAESGKLRK